MGLLEDKGLDTSIVCGLYGCIKTENDLFIQCYDNTDDLKVGLRYSKAIDLFNLKARIGLSHNEVTFQSLHPHLLGIHRCNVDSDTLYLTSNEWDLFTLAAVAPLQHNVVAFIDKIDNFKAISNCYEFIHRFKTLIVIPTKKNINWPYEIKKRLDTNRIDVKTIDIKVFGEFNSLNEMHSLGESERILPVLDDVIDIDIPGISNLGYEKCVYTNQLNKIYTMFDYMDAVTGGMILGDVWLLTGFTGSGKTEFSMQLTLAAVEQNHNVFVYSGEIPKGRYLSGLLGKIVGSQHVKKVARKLYGGREASKAYDTWLEPHIEEKAKEWIKNKYYIYDSSSVTFKNEYDHVLHMMELAHKEYGCTMFVVDNLMSLMCTTLSKDLIQEQGMFTNKLIAFAKKYNVHVQLVAHPRKTMSASITNYDIAGSSNIANLAHVILSVNRADEEQKQKDIEAGKEPRDSEIQCTKNRTTGELFKYPLFFNKDSKTFSPIKGEEIAYSWDKTEQQSIDGFIDDGFWK